MSKIMTTSEFIKQHGLRSTEDLMTSYAEYFHSAKMQEVGEDVEDEINSMYPIEQELGNNHIVEMQNLRNAAKFGYNLHKSDAVSLDNLFLEHANFCEATFPNATFEGAVEHAKLEVREFISDVKTDAPKENQAIEMADIIMCLLDAARRVGISTDDIKSAFAKKLAINKGREWNYNPAGFYTHK